MEVAHAYSTLGVRSGATTAEIRAAYRTQLRRFHPDAGGGGDPATLSRIRGAYRTIVERGPVRARDEPAPRAHVDVYA